MTAAIVLPDSDYITALIGAAEFRRMMVRDGHATENAADALLENREQLAALVNTLFWTSLGVEEGRAVRGAVCICSPDQAHRARVLERSEPMTLRSLTGHLTASPDVPLAVHLDGSSPTVWGFLDSRPFQTLTLRIGGPGTIVAIVDRNTVALLHEGRVHVTDSIGALNLSQLLAKALNIEATFPERFKCASALAIAITAMHACQHGGAVVIAPTSNDNWKRAVDVRFKFTSSSSRTLSDLLLELETAGAGGDTMGPELERCSPPGQDSTLTSRSSTRDCRTSASSQASTAPYFYATTLRCLDLEPSSIATQQISSFPGSMSSRAWWSMTGPSRSSAARATNLLPAL